MGRQGRDGIVDRVLMNVVKHRVSRDDRTKETHTHTDRPAHTLSQECSNYVSLSSKVSPSLFLYTHCSLDVCTDYMDLGPLSVCMSACISLFDRQRWLSRESWWENTDGTSATTRGQLGMQVCDLTNSQANKVTLTCLWHVIAALYNGEMCRVSLHKQVTLILLFRVITIKPMLG